MIPQAFEPASLVGIDMVPESPYYRVAVKVLVKDNEGKLLVCLNPRGGWEIPGGGLEHDESVESCIEREMLEEIGSAIQLGSFRFFFRSVSPKWKYAGLRLVFDAELNDPNAPLSIGDDMVEARFVDKDEFLKLKFVNLDQPIQDFANEIFG